MHSEREVNGQKAPDASDRMKDMSPEKRARFEAMMKARGVETGGSGMSKMCYTSEMLKHSPWAQCDRLQSHVQQAADFGGVEMAYQLPKVGQ